MSAHSESCNANLCAEHPNQQELRGWYPGETICTAHGCSTHVWNRNQKKIQRLHEKSPVPGFFTFNMLNGTFRVQAGIAGIDDERPRGKSEREWIEARHWTAEQIQRAKAVGSTRVGNLHPEKGPSSSVSGELLDCGGLE